MSDKRKRCPICECVMHGPRHYGSERTCLLVLDLKDRGADLLSALKDALEHLESMSEAFAHGEEECSGDSFETRFCEQNGCLQMRINSARAAIAKAEAEA